LQKKSGQDAGKVYGMLSNNAALQQRRPLYLYDRQIRMAAPGTLHYVMEPGIEGIMSLKFIQKQMSPIIISVLQRLPVFSDQSGKCWPMC
jgi:hypothetical protein